MGSSDDPGARFRAEMVAHLTERGGVSDLRVATVLGQVPRHLFLPGVGLSTAYADQAIVTHHRDGVPISSASQPAITAKMLEQLDPPAGGSVLEIGAGTGYNAALLSRLVGSSGRVVTVDIDPEVAGQARDHLAEAGIANVEVICGDGAEGWADGAPYDGIIVTAGASDLAPAWADQLGVEGRLVVPLSIRGVQQCVALTLAGDHLRSVAVCGCQFMPLAGAMASTDRREPVPGHPDVQVQAAAGTEVDIGLVRDALSDRGPATGIGITAPAREVIGSLRHWLAFHEPASALLSYVGPPQAADASGVPAVNGFTSGGVTRRYSPCILGPAGFAVLDLAGPAGAVGGFDPGRTLELAVGVCGEAEQQAVRLGELVTAWDAAGRPGIDRLRIDAYPSGAALPDIEATVHPAQYATFVVSRYKAGAACVGRQPNELASRRG
jgi:protein-L-isoaspartate(D-aspartate) O-methyltransferase